MAKSLCMFGLALAAIILLVFLVDISLGFPFSRYSILMNVIFMAVSLVLAWLSWKTFKEQ
ncbi:MAG: hypothetical protein Q4C96_05545 [Planctomycetia bacterium]|nr:hypothetical protein [Planctomycetia bacterium]